MAQTESDVRRWERLISTSPCRRVSKKKRGTVRNYVSAILDKLGVEDRTQAAILAIQAGLTER